MASALIANLSLIVLSLALLPFTTAILLLLTILLTILHRLRHEPSPPRKTVAVLVTGVAMAKGLCLARLFHRRGLRVVGVDCSRLAAGRVSASLDAFHLLPSPGPSPSSNDAYVRAIVHVVRREGLHLCVFVSDVKAAVHDALASHLIHDTTAAQTIQLSLSDIQTLDAKDTFASFVSALGLPTPDTRVVTSSVEAIDFLRQRCGLRQPARDRYLVKAVGVNDEARFDMPLLPLPTETETLDKLAAIPFAAEAPFVLQRFVRGPEFCTHALVVRGRVRAFVACPSSDLLMHYVALPSDSPLNRKMLAFTRAVVGPEWTGHVSFDFLLGKDGELYPIECNPRVHTAVVLFRDTPQLVDEYLGVLEPERGDDDEVLFPHRPRRYYWVGQDLVEAIFCPLLARHVTGLADGIVSFARRVCEFRDGAWEAWDPWPWWWLYHVYWPARFAWMALKGERWSRVNVSTGKVFRAR
ncbi:ATP-grasp enzyme-like protein [Ophiocordyceps camponoti-floridani]|uniref:ATP-grasp enzyme-like protein n=1 Tax=Ophiocordyceps camponoti-floridani TaxID=2030778 RepID=A0A8H4VF70_9HYPO|nr:ATP-grasp enzyme-like protein [Ophiocordyceps camponoti-floridani]